MINLVFNRSDFIKSLEHCMSSIDKKSTMPILSNVLINIEGDNCNIISTNLETSVISYITPVSSNGTGKIAVPAKYIYDSCKIVTTGDTITFSYDQNNMLLNMTSGRTNYNIPCCDASDFPIINVEDEDRKDINISKIISGYKKIQFSMSDANINKSYSGILIKRFEDNSIEMVSTDIHRISVLSLKDTFIDIEDLDEGIVISGRNFAEIAKIFSASENVKVSIKDGKMTLKNDDVIFISRLMKNEFPNYKAVTGNESVYDDKEKAVIDRKELIDGVKRVIVLSSEEKIWGTKFEFKGNLLSMNSNSKFGGSSKDEIVIDEPFTENKMIGINARYLLDVLSSINEEKVKMIVEEQLKPMTIIEKNNDFFYIHMVMPLKI